MPNLKLKLDEETFDALKHRAQSERRPVDWQAEVILRQSLGLAFPCQTEPSQSNRYREASSISPIGQEATDECK
jgi:hypothetical protein